MLLSLLVVKDEMMAVLIDREKVENTVRLTKPFFKEYYNHLEISDGSRTKKYSFRKELKLNIWKLDIGDTDGDGINELALGVYTKAPHHSVYAKRVFLYNIEDLELVAKFRASRLISPMEDFILYDIDNDGKDNVISLEKFGQNYRVRAYYQYDMLIEKIYESEEHKALKELYKNDSLYINGEDRTYELYLEDKEIKLR